MEELIKKEDFCKAIESVRDAFDCTFALESVLCKYKLDGGIPLPPCCDDVINLLHIIAGEADCDDWVSWFCFEKTCGRDSDLQAYIDKRELKLDTPEDLYAFLCNDPHFVDDETATTEELGAIRDYIAKNMDECSITGDTPERCIGCEDMNWCYTMAVKLKADKTGRD